MRRWITCAYLSVLLVSGQAQTGNPFELGPRPAAPTAAAVPVASPPANPFELSAPAGEFIPAGVPTPVPPPATEAPVADGDERALFGLFVGLSLLLTLVVVLLRSDLRKCYQAFLNENLLNGLYRTQTGVATPPLQLLHLSFLFSGGFYLLLLVRSVGAQPFTSVVGSYFACFGLLGAAVALKHLGLFALGRIFPLQKPLGRYSFTIMIFSIILGFGLYPFSALLAFGPETLQEPIKWASFGFVGLLYFFRSARALFNAGALPLQRAFHFFLYLCSIEIAPILLLWKALS